MVRMTLQEQHLNRLYNLWLGYMRLLLSQGMYLQMYALAMMLSRRSLNSKKVSASEARTKLC